MRWRREKSVDFSKELEAKRYTRAEGQGKNCSKERNWGSNASRPTR